MVEPGTGTGPPLVMVHGVGLDLQMWDLVVPSLVRCAWGPCHVVRYDLLGHGKTPTVAGELTIDDFVTQLDEVISFLDSEAPPDVMGLSLGGAIVRRAAVKQTSEMGRLVLANTVFERTPEQRQGNLERLKIAEDHGLERVADLALDRWFTDPWRLAHPDRARAVHDSIVSSDPDGYVAAYRAFIHDDPTEAGQLTAVQNETFVITGSRDRGSTPEMAQAMAAALPNGSAMVLDGIGHLPPIEDPNKFSTVLLDFLE